MHELSLMSDLLKKIQEVAHDQGSDKVVGVCVKLGALAHISESHFRGHFKDGTRGTLAEHARLDVELCADIQDEHAQDILLTSVEVETP